MADKKISALTGASTPLAGTEVLPIVQSGNTVKVSVANLTAGRSITSSKLEASGSGELLKLITSGNTASGGLAFLRFYDSVGARGYVGYVGTDTLQITGNKIELQPSGGNDVLLSNGNLVIGTAGKGIDFTQDPNPAGMTSELLDDYEEGTWTPTDASGAGLTFTTSNTSYTKVGNLVTVTGIVTFPSTLDASAAQIGGLPFTAKASTGGFFPAVNNASLNIVGNVSSGAATFFLAQPETTNNRTNLNMSGKLIAFSGTYLAA
jgi:hypothetical protein